MKTTATITIFKDVWTKVNPTFIKVEDVISAIRKPSEKTCDLIDKIRDTSDTKERNELKKKLPCIIFTGKFEIREDSSWFEHSGMCVIDLDHVKDVELYKKKLRLIDHVVSVFVSPSGDGLKVVIKIPNSTLDVHNHEYVYKSVCGYIQKNLNIPEDLFDGTSINPSRACYASKDAEIYYNPSAKVFIPPPKEKPVQTDYVRMEYPIKMIRYSEDGHKHEKIRNACYWMGGLVRAGIVDKDIAEQALRKEIEQKPNIDDWNNVENLIKTGLEKGMQSPLREIEQMETEFNLDLLSARLADPTRGYEFLTNIETDNADLERYRNGGFKQGLKTGHVELDKHFRWKEGDFNAVIGHANTGKSYFMWWLMVIAAVMHEWSWIVYSTENKVRMVKKKLMEFYGQERIDRMTKTKFNTCRDWVNEYFTFIRIDEPYSAPQLFDYADILLKQKSYKGFLVDPYNSLKVDDALFAKFKGNRHEYDYSIGSMFVNWSDTRNVSTYLNAHAITEALRRKHSQTHPYAGHPMPPEAADMEGGGKWVNRVTGFLMVIHRYIYHDDADIRNRTKVEIKKVKDIESGGKPTKYEQPIDFYLEATDFTADDYMCHFREVGGNCPISFDGTEQNTNLPLVDLEQDDPF